MLLLSVVPDLRVIALIPPFGFGSGWGGMPVEVEGWVVFWAGGNRALVNRDMASVRASNCSACFLCVSSCL